MLVFEVLPVVGKVSQAKLSLALDVDADPTDLLKAHIFFSASFIERRDVGAGHRSGLGATVASGLRRSGPPEWTWVIADDPMKHVTGPHSKVQRNQALN